MLGWPYSRLKYILPTEHLSVWNQEYRHQRLAERYPQGWGQPALLLFQGFVVVSTFDLLQYFELKSRAVHRYYCPQGDVTFSVSLSHPTRSSRVYRRLLPGTRSLGRREAHVPSIGQSSVACYPFPAPSLRRRNFRGPLQTFLRTSS